MKLVLNALAALCLFFSWGMVHSIASQSTLAVMTNRDIIFYPVLITSCIMGIFGIKELKKDFTQKRGVLMVAFSITLLLISIFSIYGVYYFSKHYTFCYNKGGCQINLRNLLGELTDYRHDNKICPPSETWCDALCQHKKNMFGHRLDRYFVCPGANEGRCNFALNPNVTIDSPPDTVWIFDSYPGWNLSGGRELMNCNNHEGKGCNVLFRGGNIMFVEKEKLDELKWE